MFIVSIFIKENLQQEVVKGNINNNVLTTRNHTKQAILSSTHPSQYISNQSILLKILDSTQIHHSRYFPQPCVQPGLSSNYLKPNDRKTFSNTKRNIGSEQQHNLSSISQVYLKIKQSYLTSIHYLVHPQEQKANYIPKSQIYKEGLD